MTRRLAFGMALLVAALWWGPATAQPAEGVPTLPPPILTLNQERLYLNSAFGQRVRRTQEQNSIALAAENRQIEAALEEEEQKLTEDRVSMDPEAFRALAEDFDIRVTAIRRAQVDKRNQLQRVSEAERARFFELAYPVLFELVQETGALAILNQSAVILSARQIDVTELAIARINAEIGEAPPDPEPAVAPLPRPDPQPAPTDPELDLELDPEQAPVPEQELEAEK